jgi:hypothetical protein
VTTRHPYIVTDEVVRDILDAAFYDGIWYWADKPVLVKTGNPVPEFDTPTWPEFIAQDKGYVTMTEIGETTTLRLDKAAIVRGIRKAAEHFGLTVARFHDEHDAGYADIAVQFALLNEIRYG